MDRTGVVVASSMLKRPGEMHPIAARIMRGEFDRYDVTAEEAAASPTMPEGCNVAIDFQDERIASISIAAPLEHAKAYAAIVQTLVLAMLQSNEESMAIQVDLHSKLAAYTKELETEIAKQNETETKLRKSQERFRDVAEIASDWIWEMDENLRFSYFSDRFEAVTGESPINILGKTRREVGADDADDTKWALHIDDLEAHRPFKDFVYTHERPDGTECHWSICGKPVFDSDDKFLGYRGTGTELTAQIEASRRAEAAQVRLEESIEAMSEGFALFDADDVLVLCNRNHHANFEGLETIHPLGMKFEDIMKAFAEADRYQPEEESIESFLERRYAHHKVGSGAMEVPLAGGRWLLVHEYRTYDGGTLTLSLDITEAKQAHLELLRAKRNAEEANRTKTEFLNLVSHDLRTPLTSICSFAEILNDNPQATQEERERFLGIISEEGARLTRLINDLLDFAKIDSGSMKWIIEDVSLNEVVGAATDSMNAAFRKREVDVEIQMPDKPFIVRGDRDRLIQVVVNLLSNACKFAPSGVGKVYVTLEPQDGHVCLSVADNGPGLAPEHHDAVFEDFRQIQAKDTVHPKGTGLGLAICKKIVEHLGGSIWVESLLGQGATFWLKFPA